MIGTLRPAPIARESGDVAAFLKCTLGPEMVGSLDITVSTSRQGTGDCHFVSLASDLHVGFYCTVAAIPYFD